MIQQTEMQLPAFPRGFHLITEHITKHLSELPKTGLLHVFIKHTSAGICINEGADPDVLTDFETVFNRLVPENDPAYVHTIEGSDDMPAHIKSVMSGSSVTIPITNHRLNLGTWQAVYLCEFRNRGGRRKLVLTVWS